MCAHATPNCTVDRRFCMCKRFTAPIVIGSRANAVRPYGYACTDGLQAVRRCRTPRHLLLRLCRNSPCRTLRFILMMRYNHMKKDKPKLLTPTLHEVHSFLPILKKIWYTVRKGRRRHKCPTSFRFRCCALW